MTNLHEMLEKARAAGQKLAPGEGAVLFAAAVRLAASQGSTLRSRLLQIDEAGGLHLLPFDERERESEPSYLAPELLGSDAPRKVEPRVQVYAAGALGYELLTGMPASQRSPGPELSGAMGDIVRMALSPDRRERFGGLTELQDALEGVLARPPAEGERNILAALRTRLARPPPEKEALARLIEKVSALEQQVSKMQARSESLQQSIEHFEEGELRLQKARPPSVVVPAFFAGVLGAAAVLVAGFAMGVVVPERRAPVRPAPVAEAPPQPEVPAAVSPAPAPAQVKTAEAPASAPADAGPLAEMAPDAAPPPLPALPDVLPDAGQPPAAASEPAAPAPAATATALPPPVTRSSPGPALTPKRLPVSPGAMTHALALSQVHRGEAALEHGHADDALSSFRGALESEPGIASAWRGMGMAYAVQGNDSQALQAYEKYLKLSPSAPDAADIRRSIAELKERGKLGGEDK